MKILVVSMRSIHTVRWLSQLKDSNFEVHFFDILNGGYIKELSWVQQHTNWRYKFGDFKGRYFIKKYAPGIHKLLEHNLENKFEKVLLKVQPDIVQSFVMYMSCVPILEVMKKHRNIKWIYSAWGNDLYYYRNLENHRKDIIKTLSFIDYMFADCERDIKIARELGFNGVKLGVFPGGGGYEIKKYINAIRLLDSRNIILVKGYEQRFGKAINVIKALIKIENNLTNFRVVVFGADPEFYEGLKAVPNIDFIEVIGRMEHGEVIKLMGESLIYIGNSVSDGMPNTLLEAIIMETFPIQSNPGGATEEIIVDGKNGLLINDCNNIDEIAQQISFAITNPSVIKTAAIHNRQIRQNLEYEFIKKQVLAKYALLETT